MACACGGGSKTTSSRFVVTEPSGKESKVTTQVEATAKAQRTGGTWRKE